MSRSKSKRGYARAERVGQQVLEVVAGLLLTDIKDPRVQNVQVVDITLTQDLRQAKIWWVPLDIEAGDDLEEMQAGLESAACFLRRELGDRLRLKFLPELTFHFDESQERGRRLEALIDSLSTEPGSE